MTIYNKIKEMPIYYKVLSAIFLAGIVFGAFIAVRYITTYNKKNITERVELYISEHTTYSQIIDTLKDKTKNIRSFERCFKGINPEHKLSTGYYTFKPGTTNKSVARAITKGWQTPIRLTLSGNIRGMEKLSSILGKKMMHDSAKFSAYFNLSGSYEKFGFSKETFAAMFLPNTYEIYWDATPEQFAERMKKEYDRFWNSERMEKAGKLNLTPLEVSILASIVCEESNYKPELPTIAGVYLNRLKRGMKLEADPTVKFALNDPGIKRILFKHLKVDSPYNTYKHTGLPPGPITIPSIAGIDAVLNYQEHKYLYFCADASLNGTHKFARTLSEHNRNARAYQYAISKRK